MRGSPKTMRLLTKLFVWIWSAWAGITFSIGICLMLPILAVPAFLQSEILKRKASKLLHHFAGVMLLLWGVRVTIKNQELIQSDKQVVYVPNHRSYLDAMISYTVIPNYIKYLGKAEILGWPVLGFIVKHYHVAVQRDDAGSRALSMEQLSDIAKTGVSIGIFPEGTCNTTPYLLKDFFDGAFKLAITNQIPIVPLTYIGAGELMPRNGILLRPGKVIVYWHQPIFTTGLTLEDIPTLKGRVRDVLLADLTKHYPNGYQV